MGINHLKINSFIRPHVVPNLKVAHVIYQVFSHWSNVIDVKADVMLLYGKEEMIHFNNSPFVFHVRKLQTDLVMEKIWDERKNIYFSMHLCSLAKVLHYPKKHCIHLQNFCIFLWANKAFRGNGKLQKWSKFCFVFCKTQANAKFKFKMFKKCFGRKQSFSELMG